LSNNFIGETGSLLVSNSSGINYVDVDISNLNTLPINNQVPVYFRIKNICGNNISSSYNNVFSFKCEEQQEQLYFIILSRGGNPCNQWIQYDICDFGFCGFPYYINASSFEDCTIIKNQDGINNAPPSWYYNGNISRYWNGSIFTQTLIC